MKKLIFAIMALASFAAQAQIPELDGATTETSGALRTGKFAYYDYGTDTAIDETTVKSIQFYLEGDLTINEQKPNLKAHAENGKLVTSREAAAIVYKSGTRGKVMEIRSRPDSTVVKTIDDDNGQVTTTSVIKFPRTLWVSFDTKDADVLIPFSVGPYPKEGNQFTTSGALSQVIPIGTYKIHGKTYHVAGTGTLLYPTKNKRTFTRKVGNGHRWNE